NSELIEVVIGAKASLESIQIRQRGHVRIGRVTKGLGSHLYVAHSTLQLARQHRARLPPLGKGPSVACRRTLQWFRICHAASAAPCLIRLWTRGTCVRSHGPREAS